MVKEKIAIIGGGAAGFFTAVNLAERKKNLEIHIYEASSKLLSKVKISGGGRCNVTNEESNTELLLKKYPRGHQWLKPVFEEFDCRDTYTWFEERGVPLKTESDGRVFPRSNSSQSIIDLLVGSAKKLGVKIHLNHRLKELEKNTDHWLLNFGAASVKADKVVICTGGTESVWNILRPLGINIVDPVPSLFTLNIKDHHLRELSGISLQNASILMDGRNYTGTLLITHKGLSGPITLSFSAWEAITLNQLDYKGEIRINWDAKYNSDTLRVLIQDKMNTKPKEKVRAWKEHDIPKRLFAFLCDHARIGEFTNWAELGKKGTARLVEALCMFTMQIESKSTFKEEFVTAGGVDLKDIEISTMSHKNFPSLFFSGEVLNIDAETGGYNFQAAWSTAYLVSKAV